MKSALFLVLALAIPSTAAMATGASQKANPALAEPSARKAGGCGSCICCDLIVIGGIKMPIGMLIPTPSLRRE